MKRNLYVGASFVALVAVLGIGSAIFGKKAEAASNGPQAPRFEVDPGWPKPLPNHWLTGNTIGVSVDSNDHIWTIHRGATLEPTETYAAQTPPQADCCASAPPILEYDEEGNLIGHWGGPDTNTPKRFDWPDSNHGITVDFKGNVWIGGNGGMDGHILKFTQDGKFLMQIGKPGAYLPANGGKGSNDLSNFNKVAKIFVDKKTNELIVADGYGNKRVAVFDAETGKYKRHWGAYGNVPDDTPPGPYNPDAPVAQQFRNPVHCAELSNDGFIYVCDRVNDRIQIFKPDGKFVKEVFVFKKTLGDGAVWDIAFSKDPQQKFLYLCDGANERIYIFDRASMEILTTFGDGGRQPGQFYAVHSIATDSKGNIFTTETYRGQRVQKFVYKGLAPVTKKDQGTVWPKK